ncbi:MAG: cytochrome c family protein [Pseudomonadota bacterium]
MRYNVLKTSLIATGMVMAVTTGSWAVDGGDATKGESVFKRCMSCHMVGDDAKNKVGPVLNNVFGRAAGTFEGYKYGKSIVAAGEASLVWDANEIFEYLGDPKKYLRAKLEDKKAKSKMSFKLKKEEDRKDVIAYLKTFSAESEAAEDETSEESSTTN